MTAAFRDVFIAFEIVGVLIAVLYLVAFIPMAFGGRRERGER